MVSQRSITVQV